MRILCCVALLVLATAAAGQPKTIPKVCECPPQVQQRLQRALEALGPARVFRPVVAECSKQNPKGCQQDVRVTASGDKCFTELPYCSLCVRGMKKDQVRWRLVDKDGKPTNDYEFSKDKGIDIPNAQAGGKKHFTDPDHAGSKYMYKWTVGDDVSAGLDHAVNVHVRGNEKATCSPYDPIIVNSDQ